tara:strand:+ start:1608 stop:2144 length:537 start_codon:yes stop_codon:yes gene_type:complete
MNTEQEVSVDPLVEQGLLNSSQIFDTIKTKLDGSKNSDSASLSRTELRAIRKQSLAMNDAFSRYVKQATLREHRFLVEIHLLRQAAHKDSVDRDANRARVYEYLRRYRTDDERLPALSSSVNINPLHAPSVAAAQVDKAMSTATRVEGAILLLSPTGKIHVHGAGMLTSKMDEDAESI